VVAHARVSFSDGGFFVFGDISARVVGEFRLKFTLFDCRFRGDPNRQGCQHLKTVFSDPFKGTINRLRRLGIRTSREGNSIYTEPYTNGYSPKTVVQQKDFHGLDESTYLSRAFSDQGVRLRLRKEPRTFAGAKKRRYNDPPPESPSTDNGYGSRRPDNGYGGGGLGGSIGGNGYTDTGRADNGFGNVGGASGYWTSSVTPNIPSTSPWSSYGGF
jgi:hypothetical protein